MKLAPLDKWKLFAVLVVWGICIPSCEAPKTPPKTPKLLVGIVVDQMRYDFLTRYAKRYGNGGFKKLQEKGFSYTSHHFSYLPTYTGPGHATVFTGSTPSAHLIIANDWFDRKSNKMVYCVEDTSVVPVGVDLERHRRSPKNLGQPALGELIKERDSLAQVFGISLKDRGAILPVGKGADGAFWLSTNHMEAQFVTSSYYMNQLPQWVIDFKTNDKVHTYLSQWWETLYSIETYKNSGPDNATFEKSIWKGHAPVFPYDLTACVDSSGVKVIKSTPFGNSLLTDFALELITQNKLGNDAHMDLLTISYSATDYVGHNYGPNSIEIEDTYLRMDAEIERLLKFLDAQVGPDAYTVFLTADHGVVDQPAHKAGEVGGYIPIKSMVREVDSVLFNHFKVPDLVQKFSDFQFYLDEAVLTQNSISKEQVFDKVKQYLQTKPFVNEVLLAKKFKGKNEPKTIQMVLNGWSSERSGDILIVYESGWISDYYAKHGGSDHGSIWDYDTHVPFLIYGAGVVPEASADSTFAKDVLNIVLGTIE